MARSATEAIGSDRFMANFMITWLDNLFEIQFNSVTVWIMDAIFHLDSSVMHWLSFIDFINNLVFDPFYVSISDKLKFVFAYYVANKKKHWKCGKCKFKTRSYISIWMVFLCIHDTVQRFQLPGASTTMASQFWNVKEVG